MGFLTKGGIYVIENVADNQRVNVSGSSLNNGAAVISWGHGAGVGGNESWVANPVEGDTYKFTTQINGNKGQRLDEAVSSHQANLWQPHDGANQKWIVTPVAYQIKSIGTGKLIQTASAPGRLRTVNDSGTDDRSTWWVFHKN